MKNIKLVLDPRRGLSYALKLDRITPTSYKSTNIFDLTKWLEMQDYTSIQIRSQWEYARLFKEYSTVITYHSGSTLLQEKDVVLDRMLFDLFVGDQS